MDPIHTVKSRTLVLPNANIDTDQIIPARFLTITTREGLGSHLFADWRNDAEGRPRRDCPLNEPGGAGCEILVAGRNFGCGSSREHAPWALLDYGFRAVVSSEIADIFRNNALKNGLLPVVVEERIHRWLIEHPGVEVTIDVVSSSIELPFGDRVPFQIERFARHCLINGINELEFITRHRPEISAYERRSVRPRGAAPMGEAP